jgi:hypothetical protein
MPNSFLTRDIWCLVVASGLWFAFERNQQGNPYRDKIKNISDPDQNFKPIDTSADERYRPIVSDLWRISLPAPQSFQITGAIQLTEYDYASKYLFL